MKVFVCGILLLVAETSEASLNKYSSLVVADENPQAAPPANSIRITYLGVNGFQFETKGHALLVDPYFTRVALLSAVFNQPIRSDSNRVAAGLKHVRSNVDGILITHAHFDHLLDAPEIIRRTRGVLLAGPTAIQLVEASGISNNRCEMVRPGSVRKIGPWTVRVFTAQHDRLFGRVPFSKCPLSREQSSPLKSPTKVSDWCVGEPLAFVIEAAGRRIYIDSGGVPGTAFDPTIKAVDLAILGVALPDSRKRFAEAVRQLRPRYILPSHQDDMFAPVDHGFTFGKMTNFPAVVRESKNLPGRLILLDYFRPWRLR